ncbi:MAG: hypothetical protein HLX46_07730 [Corynebacterium sp.]|uniref:hypothetical protein n=1 Tax=Corynebacterium sp. TaxID=1720 RepID=UPI00181EC6AC|nr:hypothetical protein [Corynebacterium sp.]NWO16713.1 hypothetical protein [Corynebacterium sp.]
MAIKKQPSSMKRPEPRSSETPAGISKAFASRKQSDYTVKFTVELDAQLHRELKAAAALRSVTMREIVHEAVENELGRYKN